MIVATLINRAAAGTDYQIHIDFNIDLERFNIRLDCSACRQSPCAAVNAIFYFEKSLSLGIRLSGRYSCMSLRDDVGRVGKSHYLKKIGESGETEKKQGLASYPKHFTMCFRVKAVVDPLT